MNRRNFLSSAVALAVAPMVPALATTQAPRYFSGIDYAAGPDRTVCLILQYDPVKDMHTIIDFTEDRPLIQGFLGRYEGVTIRRSR